MVARDAFQARVQAALTNKPRVNAGITLKFASTSSSDSNRSGSTSHGFPAPRTPFFRPWRFTVDFVRFGALAGVAGYLCAATEQKSSILGCVVGAAGLAGIIKAMFLFDDVSSLGFILGCSLGGIIGLAVGSESSRPPPPPPPRQFRPVSIPLRRD